MKLSYALMVGASLSFVALGCGDDSTSAGGGTNEGGGGSPGGGAPPQGGAGGITGDGGLGPVGGQGEGGGAEAASVSMVVTPETMAAGDSVEAVVTVQNFVLEEATGQPNEDGHGHFHIYFDGATGGNYLLAGQTENVEFTIPANAAPGAHTLRVSLGQNNHAPVSPAIEAIVDITVE